MWMNAKKYARKGTKAPGGHSAAHSEPARPATPRMDNPLETGAAQHTYNKASNHGGEMEKRNIIANVLMPFY